MQPNNIVRNKYEQINNIPMKINNLLSTSTGGGLNWDILLEQYQREFDTHSRPFLLCDIFDMKENMHTNLLEQLLTFNNYMLLPSFVEEVLDIDDLPTKEFIESGDVYVTTQLKALGNKKDTWGLVDLAIQIGDTNIIIENKVNEAADTRNQLLRYVTTLLYVGISSPYTATGQFDKEWYDKLTFGQKKKVDYLLQNLYVYYLTKQDSDEGPSQSSFSRTIKAELDTIGHFRKLSYENDIYQWLKKDLLPLLPQNDLLNSALQQYIAYLEYVLEPASTWQQSWITKEAQFVGADIQKYNLISKGILYYQKAKETPIADSLIKSLEFAREDIFAHDIEQYLSSPVISEEDMDLKDWRVHYTPSFIVLYKQKWAERDERNYSIPSIHITIRNPFHLASKKKKFNYQMGIDHVSPRVSEMTQKDMTRFPDKVYEGLKIVFRKTDQSLKKENHGKYFRVGSYDTNPKKSAIQTTMDFAQLDNRIAVYKDAILKLDKEIKMMDRLVEIIK